MLLPLVMLLLMAVVQAGIYFHSVAVATTAARKAVAAASVDGGGPAQGEVAGTQFLDQNGASLTNRHVVVATDGSNARVRVTGDVASLMFGVPFSVTVVVDAPIEQVSP